MIKYNKVSGCNCGGVIYKKGLDRRVVTKSILKKPIKKQDG
jgi:hypothetical protein